ncbi:MAG: fused MFS/spermidine synthase [Elusimicrobia bacterium]|nr:fused MFS/spermidine synthase [Elusimicrobiota bacterium]
MILFLTLFFVSGFCSLVYEVVWLRLAMGAFGVTAPFVSLFLSVFMAGLGLGSWGAGRLCRRLEDSSASRALRLYAGAELMIALSAFAVPFLLTSSRDLLAGAFGGVAWGSSGYYWASGACTALALLPWCACMGATFPLAMAAITKRFKARSADSFSYLYLANVVGAGLGTLASAFILIEVFGFRGTLHVAAGLNIAIAAAALAASFMPSMGGSGGVAAPAAPRAASGARPDTLMLLFMTGLVSMAMEVVWTRQFTPYLGNSVYAFALVLAAYLLASFAGACLYRARIGKGDAQYDGAWVFSGALSLLPLYAADPYLPVNSYLRIVVGIVPFCGALGFLTPALIDRWSEGDPRRAGAAYAVNIIGCILGPLIAGFGLLPRMGERGALALLAAPLFVAGLRAARRQRGGALALGRVASVPLYGGAVLLAAMIVVFSSSFDDEVERVNENARIKRDYQATVTAAGSGMERILLVNNIGMTRLTPTTKIMAHLPLAFLPRPPKNALVICFGMGTTFRSLLSWGIPATAVELVPSVPGFFGFFHEDAAKVMASPNAHVVIDDGRRFLTRSAEQYDVITLDPAPPMTAAGTSFLFSEEFYDAAKKRLAPDGIMQIWIVEPLAPVELSAFAKAVKDSFPHVRVFRSLEGWGYHCLASREPFPSYTAAQLAARLPRAAVNDLLEMGPRKTAAGQFQSLLSSEVSLDALIAPGAEGLRDDRPINEYFFLRRGLAGD